MEKWIDIDGYNGLYQISNFGRVKSLKGLTERILKQNINKYGYKVVYLSKDSKKKTISIHRLVAHGFIEREKNKLHVNHIDGNKTNNHVSNLEWVTPKENTLHALEHGLLKPNYGESNGNTKLTNEIVRNILKMYWLDKINVTTISLILEINRRTVNSIVNGVNWKNEYLFFMSDVYKGVTTNV
jgi:hypothetical protein